MISWLGSILFWTFFGLSSLVLFPLAVLLRVATFPFDRRGRANHFFTCFWGSIYTWLNPVWRVHVSGHDNLPENQACVLTPNHQSTVDVFALMRLFARYKWVSKIENFRVPFIGWNMWLCNYIALKRGSLRSNIDMLRTCKEALEAGESLLIFPEGTRSEDGTLKRFKLGAFDLAKRAEVPIVPIAINGSFDALPKNSIRLRGSHRISIRLLEPIPKERVRERTSEDLAKEVREHIAKALGVNPVAVQPSTVESDSKETENSQQTVSNSDS